MKSKKNIVLCIILMISISSIYFIYNNHLINNKTYVIDQSKYMYAKFSETYKNKDFNIYFIIPKDYTYEKFDDVQDVEDVDELYSINLLAKGGDMDGFRTSACISVEYFLTKENNKMLSEFPKSRVEGFHTNYIELTDLPKNIIKVKLLAKNYLYFMEKEHLLFIETDNYIMCLEVDLPYEYSTNEKIVEYFTELLKSLKIEEL